MMHKEIYPKTKRVKCSGDYVEVTEKLDGSNLCIFKKDGVLHFAQRRNIFTINEIDNVSYKGLKQWILDNEEQLEKIREGSVVCGEWLGMGRLKYHEQFDKRFYMFAKANINENYELYNIYYTHELFFYPFEDLVIPECVGVVPVVRVLEAVPDKERLDGIYSEYVSEVKRKVEGLIVNYRDCVQKYVRMKNGKLEEHHDWGSK